MSRRVRPVAVLAGLACLLGLGGCGGSRAGGRPDPARAMPADVPAYVEIMTKPGPRQAENASALIRAATGSDSSEDVIEDLVREVTGDGINRVSYALDIKPWLGRRIGVGYADLAASTPRVVVIAAEVDDPEAAEDFVEDDGADGGSGEYAGVTYYEGRGSVTGVKDRYLLFTERLADFKAAVDRIDDGKGSLADDAEYRAGLRELPRERLGTLWFDPEALQASTAGGSPSGEGIGQLLEGVRGISGALVAQRGQAVLETRVRTRGDVGTLSLFGPAVGSSLVREAPADAFAVYGVARAGTGLGALLQGVAGDIGGAALRERLREGYGIDLDRDVLSWAGDAVVWARGSSYADLGAALVVEATDRAAAAKALPRLVRAARPLGFVFVPADVTGTDQAYVTTGGRSQLFAVRKGDRVVVAFEPAALRAALRPSDTLGSGGTYRRLRSAAGGIAPAAVVDVPGFLRIVDATGSSNPGLEQGRRYLEVLRLLAAGGRRDGDAFVTRAVVTVK